MTLKEKAIKEFESLQVSVLELEQKYMSQADNLSSLASEIWQTLDKAVNLCMLLWDLRLEFEADKLEDLKLHLSKMHRELICEIATGEKV